MNNYLPCISCYGPSDHRTSDGYPICDDCDTTPNGNGRREAFTQYDAFIAGESDIPHDTWADWCESVATWEVSDGLTTEHVSESYPDYSPDDVAEHVAAYLAACGECAAGYRYVGDYDMGGE